LEPLTGREFFNTQQVQSTTSHRVKLTHSPTAATVTTECRMKIRRNVAVNEDEPDDDANFRIFGIENIVNVREENRELQFMVTENV